MNTRSNRSALTRQTGNWIRQLSPIDGLERIEAFFSGNAYGRHRHDSLAIGITLRGLQTFNYRRGLRGSEPGDVMVLHPDEPHDGQAGTSEGFAYRMAYVCPALLQQALGGVPLPFLEGGISKHAPLREATHALLQGATLDLDNLETHDAMVDLAIALVNAAGKRSMRHVGNFRAAQIAREYIHDFLIEGITLGQLEVACGTDRWRPSRDFRAYFGTSPYRYLTLRRLDLVKQLMLQNHSLVECSVAAGFADQSHMTRQFTHAFGLPPCQWLSTCRAARM